MTAFNLYGQGLIEQIAEEAGNGQIGKAKVLVDSAMLSADSTEIAVRYFQGYIYKELYKENEGHKAKEFGDIAIEALALCMRAKGEENETYVSQSERLLIYLLGQYFNDAVVHVSARSYDRGEAFFDVYEVHMATIDNSQLYKARVKYYKLLASTYAIHAGEDDDESYSLYLKALEANEKLIEFNEASFFAHYNSGLMCYTMSQKVKDDEDKAWLGKAVVHLKRAEAIQRENLKVTEALLEVYKEMGDTEKTAQYEQKLKDAKK